MALDASIYNNIQQPKPVNLLADYANLMQVQGAQQANKLNQLKFDAYEREQQDNNALRSALSAPGADPYNALLRIGRVKEAAEYRKAEAEGRRAKIGEDSDAFKLAKDRYGMFQQTLGSLAQEPNLSKPLVLQAGQSLVQQGLLPQAMFEQTAASLPDDPAQLRARLQQSLKTQLTPEQVFTMFAPKATEVDNGQFKTFRDTNSLSPTYGQTTAGPAVQKVASPESVLSAETTRRGQNMTDARARETLAQGQWQYDSERGGLVNKVSGEFRPATQNGAPISAGGKPLNEGQGKANLFGTRMQEANAILNGLEDKGVYRPGDIKTAVQGVVGAMPLIGDSLSDGAGAIVNATPTWLGGPNADQQKVEQARRDFINAVLRRESGAVISPEEFRNAEKQYFPQVGDEPEVIAQKRRNRELSISGIEAEVPGGFRTKAPARAAGPNIDALLKKYQ